MPHPTRSAVLLLLASVSLPGLPPAEAAPPGEPAVSVRAGRHPAFDRLVVDWPGPVRPEVRRDGDTVRVSFRQPGRLDLAGLGEQLGRHILRVDAVREGGAAVLVAQLRPGAGFELSALADNRIVLDARGAEPAAPPAGAARRMAAVSAGTAARALRPAPAVEAAAMGVLRQELYRRDLMIASLLQRVERLERGAVLPEPSLDESAPSMPDLVPAVVQVAEARPPEPLGPVPRREPEPAAGAEERALERVLARDGTLLLRPGEVEVEPGLSFTWREDDAPVFVNGGTTFFIGEDEARRRELEASLALRFGLPFDSQLEVALPYRYVDQSTVTELGFGEAREANGSGRGAGDFTLAAAKTLTRQEGWRPDLVARVAWDTRSGETEDDGVVLGGGFDELSVSFSALRRQDPLAFFATLSYETTLEHDDVDPGDEAGLALGAALALSPATSLRVSVDQRFAWESELDGRRINGSDRTAAVLSLDAASIIGRGVLVDVGFDVGLTDDAPDYAARISVPLRFNLPML